MFKACISFLFKENFEIKIIYLTIAYALCMWTLSLGTGVEYTERIKESILFKFRGILMLHFTWTSLLCYYVYSFIEHFPTQIENTCFIGERKKRKSVVYYNFHLTTLKSLNLFNGFNKKKIKGEFNLFKI